MTVQRGNNLDLLRLLFASLVLLSHAPEVLDGNPHRELLWNLTGGAITFGGFAVDGFFALSGYLIMGSWQRHPQLLPYFRNRVLRIYPAFIVAFCVSVLLVGPVAAGGEPYFTLFGARRFFSSMMTLREPWFATSFPGLHYHETNGAMWTISYEFTCYVAVAGFGFFARRHLKSAWLAATVLLLVAACFLPEMEPLPQVNRYRLAPLVRLGVVFFAGGSLFLLGFDGLRSRRALVVVGVLFAAPMASARFCNVGYAVLGSVFFLTIGLRTAKLRFTDSWPDISYGTYLYGWPVMSLILWAATDLGPWLVFCLSLAASLLCGYLSWILIEAPFMRLKVRSPARLAVPVERGVP